MRELDQAVFRAINGAPDWLSPVMVFFSEGSKWWWVRGLLLALFVFFLWKKSTRTPAVLAMLAWPLANAACDLLKYGLQLPRPCVELADVVLRVHRLTSFGTASAHAATMMAVAVAFLFYHRPIGYIWLGIAVLTGLSRVYVGVHYPSQVLLGWAVGAVVSLVVVMAWRLILRRRTQGRQESAPLPTGP